MDGGEEDGPGWRISPRRRLGEPPKSTVPPSTPLAQRRLEERSAYNRGPAGGELPGGAWDQLAGSHDAVAAGITSLDDGALAENEIAINQWLHDLPREGFGTPTELHAMAETRQGLESLQLMLRVR